VKIERLTNSFNIDTSKTKTTQWRVCPRLELERL
jgi:hypothetical protein